MSVDFQAFTSSIVLDTFQKKIQALDCWNGKVFAGLADGTLVVLEPNSGDTEGPWQVAQALKTFSKKHAVQMQVWQDASMLLSLDDEGVSLHKLPAFKLQCLANRTRYAQRFAWDGGRAMLAVAIKRKLLVFHYNGNEFVELKELSLPDSVMAMAWLGESICIGLKKEYILLNVNTGVLTDLFKPGGPCLTPVGPDQELLLSKGNVGILLGRDGRVSRKASLTWSDVPLSLTFSRPYAVALLPNYVEIRSVNRLSANGLAQVLPLRGMSAAAACVAEDGSVFLASGSDGGIRCLAPVPFRQQAESLADAEEFQEALQLASFIPDSQVNLRTEVTNALRIRYGHRLFAEGEFDEAMAHFGMCSNASPLVLLNLFPSLAPPTLLEPLQDTISGYKLPGLPEPGGESYQKAVEVLLPYLMSHRSRLAAMEMQERAGSLGDAGEATTSGREENGAGGVVHPSPSKKGKESVEDLGSKQRAQLAKAVDTAILKAMLATSDTGALLRFVQRPNSVDLAEGEAALRSAGRYSEVVALLQSRGQHSAALDLLKQVSQRSVDLPVAPQGAAAELGGVTGVWAAVRYLVTVGGDNLDLVKRHARWILKADPEAGLEMFIQMGEALPPSAALSVLTAQAPALCAPYLEAALANGSATPREYHNDLAGIYLRLLLNEGGANSGVASEAKEGSSLPAYARIDPLARLKELVVSSEFVDAHHILLTLPTGRLPELRALLLEQIGHHQEALRLYVNTMRNPRLAEAYCDRMYEAAMKQRGQATRALWTPAGDSGSYDMYLALIQVYLEREGPDGRQRSTLDSENWGEVAQLLGRKHHIIDPLHALTLVPDEVSLQTVLSFLEGSLRSTGERRRNASVVRSLRRSENFLVREENVKCKQRCVVASFERACNICHKRIGNAVIVAYPNNTLAHYSCFKRSESSAATVQNPVPVQVYDISSEPDFAL